MADDVETIARVRIRSLRRSLGWTLDDLAERSHLSPSTVSRIETGKRTISLDVLVALAGALQVEVGALIDQAPDDDVVIRPEPVEHHWPGATVWPLTRPTGAMSAIRVRLEPTDEQHDPQVHPGHDWVYVLAGRIGLTLGERVIRLRAGEAAEFSTMTPHAIAAIGRAAELIMVFDGDGHRAHT
ncbi:helix-turn-helix domain-containing protein [Dermatobacter hominis]|uniref:helix-turn-helix domain-containing protein n=1 Tax=Dermatobacter hominis TaxID=2884263 RepID=UPI001D11F983|nr:XRE family transcriptional regulator [Dermatobacter hominis]UDY35216.1 XRE family transcriptional regulator [Dermatobacter hominis]